MTQRDTQRGTQRCGAAWLLTAPLVGLLLPAALVVRWSLRALAEYVGGELAAALDPDVYLGAAT